MSWPPPGTEFTADWFDHNIPTWEEHLGHLAGRMVRALEVGSYEGRSACWLLSRILTYPDARLDCVDLWEDRAIEGRFVRNIKAVEGADKVRPIRGLSGTLLRQGYLMLNSYDLIYIDGSHFLPDVLEDAILAWRLLRWAPSSRLIFDDYTCPDPHPEVRVAVDMFLRAFEHEFDVLHRGYQVILGPRFRG